MLVARRPGWRVPGDYRGAVAQVLRYNKLRGIDARMDRPSFIDKSKVSGFNSECNRNYRRELYCISKLPFRCLFLLLCGTTVGRGWVAE
jgi:hypothetical protein